jgi:hypothetical protein
MDVTGSLCISLGSSTVQLHASPGRRRACACSHAGFSSQNGEQLEKCITKSSALLCVFFFVGKRIFIKKCFLFILGGVCSVKRFQLGGKCFADVEEFETEVRKRLRQESKHFYAAGIDALVKRWDKCINVGGEYEAQYIFLSRFEYHMFYVLYPFVTFLLTLPHAFPR